MYVVSNVTVCAYLYYYKMEWILFHLELANFAEKERLICSLFLVMILGVLC